MTDKAFSAQQQEPPGNTAAMEPIPDHGEESYVGSGRLAGPADLITGGDSGIGRAVAIAFAREGADVAFTHLPQEAEDASVTAKLVEAEGAAPCPLEADLSESAACDRVVEDTVAALGGLDVLVNNAGYQMARGSGLADIDDDRLERTFRTNLFALFWMTRAAEPHLGAGACVINNSSIQAFEPSTSLLDYAATKAAINNATVNLAAELGPRGIRVNAVAPGPIWTPLQPATQPTEKIEQFGKDTPLGRAGQPAEVAPAFVFLASPSDAGYVSGTVLGVTGGKPVFLMLQGAPEGVSSVRTISFGGRPIVYDDTVLAPRAWTEAQSIWGRGLIEDAVPGPVLELCSGAGQIGLLAVHGTSRELVQVDSSLMACAWARRNALAWGVDSEIRHARMDEALATDECFPVILADPPWVPSSRVGRYPEDPLAAIDGGGDGLDVARTCLAVIAQHLTRHGRALLQVGDLDQARTLEPVVRDHGLRVLDVQSFDPGGILMLFAPNRREDSDVPDAQNT